MKSKITFLLLLSSLFINAQVNFEDNLVIDSSLYVQSPNSVFSADLDGDGDQDVLTSSYSGNKLVWLENLDAVGGDFELHLISSTIQTPWGVYAADLDADGDMDVVATSLSNNNVIWYENTDGNGTFVLKQAMYAYKANFVMAADVDNDSDLDLIWSSHSEGEMKWIKNTDGLGTFSTGSNIETNVTGIPGFYPADIDGNGSLDIVSAYNINGSDGISWYKNSNGTGNFGVSLHISNVVDAVTSVFAGDIDGDGDNDVISSSAGDNKIAWYENTDGLGTFGEQQILALTTGQPMIVQLIDVDVDDDLDVVFGTNEVLKISWLENIDGLGNFSTENLIALNSGSIRDIHFSDMDADGDLDFLTATTGDNNIELFKNTNNTGTYASSIITNYIDGGRVVRADDIDGDGDKDIVAASYWDDKITWYENDGLGNFYNTQKIISKTVDGATSVAIADVDGDGFKDVLATSLLSSQIVWFKNTDGLGNFGSPQIIENNLNQAYRVFLSDIDNDGDLDVFGLGYQRIAWYENLDGLGSFSNQQVIAAVGNTSMTSLDFGDLDGDGDLDIALTTSYGAYYYFNTDGQGTFGEVQNIEDFSFRGQSVKIADLDNDGDKDIAYTGEHLNASSEPPFIRWAENGGGLGDFSETHLISTIIATPKSIIVADFDNDGDIDVASADAGDGGVVAWYKNTNGQGNFENTQQIVSQSLNSPYDIYAADIDNNNTIDIVSISEYDDKIVWHKNSIIPTSNSISGTVRFDFLNDGCNDTDAVLSGILMVATDNVATNATFTQENGYFQLYTTEEGIVTTKITSQLPNYYTSNPATFESNFEGLGNNDEINFCIVPTVAINDLTVSFYPIANDPRPGFDTAYRMIYKNVGTTQLSGTVSFEFDGSKLNFLNASEAVTSQTNNTLTFDFTALNPFETKTIDLQFNVLAPPVTNINDILVATATINPMTEDYTEDDNTFSLSQTVVGSYDPNDITCLEGDEVLIEDADEYLHYLIRFQNTGTASAINVRVDHALDGKLDWNTMQLESLSHPGLVNIRNGSEVSFVFDDINLPDSTNDEPNSHGFIAYKIKPKDNIVLGDVILATAAIYFDFNPAIVTNTATTEFVQTLSVATFQEGKVTVYPNPTNGILNIVATSEITGVNIYNYLGQLVLSAKETSKIDMSSLSQGVYLINLIDAKGTIYTQKIIKKDF